MLFETLLHAHRSLIFISQLSFFFKIRNFSLFFSAFKRHDFDSCLFSLVPRQILIGRNLISRAETMIGSQLCRLLGSSTSLTAIASLRLRLGHMLPLLFRVAAGQAYMIVVKKMWASQEFRKETTCFPGGQTSKNQKGVGVWKGSLAVLVWASAKNGSSTTSHSGW